MIKEFQYTPGEIVCSEDVRKAFVEDGCFIVRGLVIPDEMKKLLETVEDNPTFVENTYDVDDGAGGVGRFCMWSHPGSDITGLLARSQRTAGLVAEMLGGEVYHYHTKLIQKDAFTGGRFQWHQDYGYWYKNGLLTPDLMTISIAIDKSDQENGCIEVIPGSHRCGRVDHTFVGGQQGADMERVNRIMDHRHKDQAILDAGDALFFHSNVLHRSGPNTSNRRRWALAIAYCTKENSPVYEHHHPQYTPLDMVTDSEVTECTNFTDFSGKEFMNPKKDETSGEAMFVKEN